MSEVDAFIGSWRETEKKGFDEMADALGLPPEKKEFFKNARTEISYNRDGDKWNIEVGIQGVPSTRKFNFKLGEPYDSQSIDGSPLKSIMSAQGCKFAETHKDSTNGMEMNIERCIDDGKMIVLTKVGPLEMSSVYQRINYS